MRPILSFEIKSSVIIACLIILLNNISCTRKDKLYKSVKREISYNDYLTTRKNLDSTLIIEFQNNAYSSFRLRENWIESSLGWGFPNEVIDDCTNSSLNRVKPLLKNNQFIVFTYSYFINDSTLFEIIPFYITRCGDISTDSIKLDKLHFIENKNLKHQYTDVLNLIKSRSINHYFVELYYDDNLKVFTHWKVLYSFDRIPQKKTEINCLYLRIDDLSIEKDTIETYDFGL